MFSILFSIYLPYFEVNIYWGYNEEKTNRDCRHNIAQLFNCIFHNLTKSKRFFNKKKPLVCYCLHKKILFFCNRNKIKQHLTRFWMALNGINTDCMNSSCANVLWLCVCVCSFRSKNCSTGRTNIHQQIYWPIKFRDNYKIFCNFKRFSNDELSVQFSMWDQKQSMPLTHTTLQWMPSCTFRYSAFMTDWHLAGYSDI